MKEKIKQLAAKWQYETVTIRRHIHAHPELSYEEYETQKFISQKLTEWGIEHTKIANTGVLAIIRSKKHSNKAVSAMRSDHDALPILEQNNVPYKSQNEGVMHGCSHDTHTACNLIAARICNDLRDEFEGTIKFVFQPAEEFVKSDGTSGARMCINDGVLENPSPKGIIAQHANPSVPFGKVAISSSRAMASADVIKICVKGQGGHAATPYLANDPLPICSILQLALQLIVSRYNDPLNPTVLSISTIASDSTAFNVLANEVTMLGTLRAYDETWRTKVHEKIKRICHNLAAAFDVQIDCEIQVGVPYLQNDGALTERVRKSSIEYLGEENVLDLPPQLTAEDFAFYSHVIPSCFYWLGVRNEDLGIVSGLHTPTMNIDERALEIGSGLFAYLAISELQDI